MKPHKVIIKTSKNPEKKYTAFFYDKDNKYIKKIHFGQKGYSDFTKHKSESRKQRYINRHKGMNEDWENPMTAGALSRWILWEKPNLKDSINFYKNKFNLI